MATTDETLETGGDPVAQLDTIFRDAIGAVLGDAGRDADPLVRTGQNPDFGDYQVNGVMGLAKKARTNPRELAGRIVEAASPALDLIAETAEVAGPGFINIRLKPTALAAMLDGFDSPRLGVTPDADTRPIAIDLCGVNIAKQMHVGHLRSTIIGDTLARVLERCGRTVHRQNHLGDWGLTIAMVLQELRDRDADLDTLSLDDLDAAYRAAQAAGDDAGHADHAKQTLIRLQQGDKDLLRDWQKMRRWQLGPLVGELSCPPRGFSLHSRARRSGRGFVESFPSRSECWYNSQRAMEMHSDRLAGSSST